MTKKITITTKNTKQEIYDYICKYDNNFPFAQAQELYNNNKRALALECTFGEFLNKYEWTVAVIHEGAFIGVLFVDRWAEDHCDISGFSKPKQGYHPRNSLEIYCNILMKEFNFDYIISETDIKPAAYCLRWAGFTQIAKKLFRKERTQNV